jgi:hypothetical protein
MDSDPHPAGPAFTSPPATVPLSGEVLGPSGTPSTVGHSSAVLYPSPPAYPPSAAGRPPATLGQAAFLDASAPYGYDPRSGRPFSEKNKLVAGVLQLLFGLVGIGGIGRLYSGHRGLGMTQLVASVVAWLCLICGLPLLAVVVGVFLLPIAFACWLWFVLDGVMMLAGRPVDGQGRPLRP